MSKRGHWWPAYVGIGSNLGMPTQQIRQAIELLDEIPGSRLICYSSLYRSAPFGGIEQPDFVNAVAAVLTSRTAHGLLASLLEIETRQGRERGETRWGPRVLDLDLLVHGNTVLDEPGLTVPHPGIGERNFVLLPLREIAPELVIPGLGRVASIAVNVNEPSISRIS
ncbi:MAG: 2-amino-4-hydroxy-6-hydroxymethyldihydropteridine diphosphokinase [Gammaproteobacteria bacterium]|nr:2-amino-4-hydroxy-6-hydroxymethyldihydropteridine diphosphokinase [Gammaproteobacteria bacterium]